MDFSTPMYSQRRCHWPTKQQQRYPKYSQNSGAGAVPGVTFGFSFCYLDQPNNHQDVSIHFLPSQHLISMLLSCCGPATIFSVHCTPTHEPPAPPSTGETCVWRGWDPHLAARRESLSLPCSLLSGPCLDSPSIRQTFDF